MEQEIDRTLEFLNETDNLSVDSAFVDRVCSRMAGMPGGRGGRNRVRFSSAIMVIILLILNITAGLVLYKDRGVIDESTDDNASVMAGEYLSEQDLGIEF